MTCFSLIEVGVTVGKSDDEYLAVVEKLCKFETDRICETGETSDIRVDIEVACDVGFYIIRSACSELELP
jgi:hypothetical protein